MIIFRMTLVMSLRVMLVMIATTISLGLFSTGRVEGETARKQA